MKNPVLISTLICVAVVAVLTTARPLTVLDLNLLPRVSESRVNPSGDTSFVFGATIWDRSANKKTTNLYLSKYGIVVGVRRLAPLDYVTDFNPVWTNDGKTVLFLSTRGGGSVNIWGIHVDDLDTAYKVSFCVLKTL